MTTGGQSISDRLSAAQHTIVGSDLSKSVLKASTSELMGPKKKHLDYLTSLAANRNINIVELADEIVDRTKSNKWVVVFKALITAHHLTCFGHERFLQHLASRNIVFNLSNFTDKSGVQGYDMSTYIRKYAKYLNEKAISYRIVAYDFTRIKRGKESGQLKMLTSEKLLKTLPVIQQQLDSLLEFDANVNELTNAVINAAFLMIFKDLIRLFACYNDGIINLLEKFFEMKKAECKVGLDLYKKFLSRTTKVSSLLKVAEQVGIDKGEIPDLTKAPSSLLDALEQHIASLEKKKSSKTSTPVHLPAAKSPVSNLTTISKDAVQSAVADEEAVFSKLKPLGSAPAAPQTVSASSDLQNLDLLTNSPAKQPQSSENDLDLFALGGFGESAVNSQQSNWSDTADIFDSNNLLTPVNLNAQQQSQNQLGNQQQSSSGNSLSIENLIANLNVGQNQQANLQFNPVSQPKLTGGSNFQNSVTQPTTMMQMQQPRMTNTQTIFNQQPFIGMQQPMMYNGGNMAPFGGMMQQQQLFPQNQTSQPQMMMRGNMIGNNQFQNQSQQQFNPNSNNPFM